ncbi:MULTISPECIES: CU044_5270 family protein [Micromonospora]|uniref:CU044_5270 family protein n=1 Tax=Micromonospora TaxID=1873 RepID=UPI001B387826|nr:CU044_5270 family protein [Micromonospora sp. C81]MBQ1040809.1 CU044_5270 family protein [Micromonospora sp. C81]WTI22285.1 CU044_5270 family protein [Micromonospora zamorensis]
MNDQQMINHVRGLLVPAEPPPHLRGRVDRMIAGSTRSAPRRSWRLATIGAGAAVGVFALLIGQVVGINGELPAGSARAAEILHRAADAARADQTPAPRADQFILTTTKNYGPVVGQKGLAATLTRSWASVDGTRDGLIWVSDPPPGGRQSTVIPGCRDGRAAEWAPDGSLLKSTRPCTPTPAYPNNVPTDTTGMLSYLRRASGGTASSDEQTFANLEELVRGYLPAQSRAALYEAATKIPGVIASPSITDAAGRAGVGVSLIGDIDRYDLIFEPQTYRFLGWQVVPNAENAADPVRSAAILSIDIVDRAEQMP